MALKTGAGVFPSAAIDNKNLRVGYLRSRQHLSIYKRSGKVVTRGFRVARVFSFGQQLVTGGSPITETFMLKNRVEPKNEVQLVSIRD